ncbi:MAG: hypothetical protein LH654_06580 [Thermoleophilia bacterium]|nr:hypothetical protein [Thermoleophilia bacterium]
MAEESVGVFEHGGELFPAVCGVGVEGGGVGVVACLFGVDGVDGGKRVLLDRQ